MLRNNDDLGKGNAGAGGLSPTRDGLRTGRNSGYQALGIAIAAGAKRVVLIGYDMRFVNGRSHWHNGHPLACGEASLTNDFAKLFRTIQTDTEILNATPGSMIDCFPRVDIAEVLGEESVLPNP